MATVLAWADLELIDALNAWPDCLLRVSEAIGAAIKEIRPDPGGRPRRYGSLRRFILELYAIHYAVTRKKRKEGMLPAKVGDSYQGAFFKFCKTCLKFIGDPIVEGGDDVPLVSQLKKAKIIKNKLSARKNFKTHPTLLKK
jgi:hypothetical protein